MAYIRKTIIFCCIFFNILSCTDKNVAHENSSATDSMVHVLNIDNYFLHLKEYLHQPVPADTEQIMYSWGPSLIYFREIDATQEYKIREEFRVAELSDDTVVKAALIMEGTTESIKMFYMQLLKTIEPLGEAWTVYNNHSSWRAELLKIPEYLEVPSTYYNMIAWKYDGLLFLIEIIKENDNVKIEIYIMEDDINLFNAHTGA